MGQRRHWDRELISRLAEETARLGNRFMDEGKWAELGALVHALGDVVDELAAAYHYHQQRGSST